MRTFASLTCGLFLASCGVDSLTSNSAQRPEVVVPMNPPFVSMTYLRAGKTEEYFVERLPRVPIGEILDLSVFGEFWPGITFEEAADRFGLPNRTRSDRKSTFHAYSTPGGYVEVGWEVFESTGKHETWTLRAYPENNLLSAVLPEQLATLEAPESVVFTQFSFLSEHGTPEMVVAARGREIADLRWLPDPSAEESQPPVVDK